MNQAHNDANMMQMIFKAVLVNNNKLIENKLVTERICTRILNNWKACKRRNRFRGSNPLLSAK